MVSVLGTGLAGSNTPLSNVTPFTYRDGETYLERLSRLQAWIQEIYDNLTIIINGNNDELEERIALLIELVNNALANNDERWAEFEDSQIAYDPTTGMNGSVNLVIGHVYDNTRYYAYFAEQLDAFEKSALEWDTMEYTARHFDLVLAYDASQANAENVVDPVDPN